MRYVCPRCKGINSSRVFPRRDKPKEYPNYPEVYGHWAAIGYEIKLKIYQLDHWNRTVICKYCGEAHHFFKDD